jgi:hypothetical protein
MTTQRTLLVLVDWRLVAGIKFQVRTQYSWKFRRGKQLTQFKNSETLLAKSQQTLTRQNL